MIPSIIIMKVIKLVKGVFKFIKSALSPRHSR